MAKTVPTLPSTLPQVAKYASAIDRAAQAETLALALADWCGVPFVVADAETGELLHRPAEGFGPNFQPLPEIVKQVAAIRSAAPLAEEGPLVLMAVPRLDRHGRGLVAVGAFATRTVAKGESLSAAAELLQCDEATVRERLSRQPVWPADALERMCRLAMERLAADDRAIELRQEAAALSANIAATYEEISLVYRVTQHLRISDDDEQLTQLALQWLADAIPAEGLAAWLVPVVDEGERGRTVRRCESTLLTQGKCPLNINDFSKIVARMPDDDRTRPLVANRSVTTHATWPLPDVREVVVVALTDGDRVFGYLAAVNHACDGEFGTIEANLLAGVASLLAVHAANIDLYRRRAELLTGIVQALTSAIEAKDQYTCGHSDRVARVAARLAVELGCDATTQNTIYLSGLLHDVGKIGIDDTVLRKPGRLTPEEFEHIKLHPELGYKILVDLKELDQVLPVVLHHHENWNGLGYPHGLAGEDIPLLARIVAVADAFDAMGSDRPYREGMPEDQVDQVIQAGAGSQWDPTVVAAFFRARDDIREIARREREALALDARQWM